jgi:hypothetical protein
MQILNLMTSLHDWVGNGHDIFVRLGLGYRVGPVKLHDGA